MSRTTGLPVSASSSSYHCTTCTQSVSVGRGGVGVQGGDRGLELELAAPLAGQRGLQDRDALRDQVGVPQAAVLLGERHEGAVRAGAGGAARVVEQHQREQPVGLRVRR